MLSRVRNHNLPFADRYAGRGIGICENWLGYESFRDWAMANGYEEHLTIDRINNDGPYSPENCRWATRRSQSLNRSNTLFVEHLGIRVRLEDAARAAGLNYGTAYARLRKGWPIEKVLAPGDFRAGRR